MNDTTEKHRTSRVACSGRALTQHAQTPWPFWPMCFVNEIASYATSHLRHEIKTRIAIAAPPERVWMHLSDFASYPSWNPLVVRAEGTLCEGKQLAVTIKGRDGATQTFFPKLKAVKNAEELTWEGRVGTSWIFQGTHSFRLERDASGGTELSHKEAFFGFIIPLMRQKLTTNILPQFEAMNVALKELAENRGVR